MTDREFVKMVAALHWDNEELPDGTETDISNDEMYDTFVRIISTARDMTAPPEPPMVPDIPPLKK